MCTALTRRGGFCTPNLADQPEQQQAEGQGEEELLQSGDRRARREEREEKEEKSTLVLSLRLLSPRG